MLPKLAAWQQCGAAEPLSVATHAVLLLVSALGVICERSKLYPDPRCQKSLASLAQLGCGRQTVLLWPLRLTVM